MPLNKTFDLNKSVSITIRARGVDNFANLLDSSGYPLNILNIQVGSP